MGMKAEFQLSELTNFMVALENYKMLSNYLSQLDPKQKERLDSIWKQDGLYDGQFYKSPVVQHWEEINIHITSQMWGSTACGWGGVGGAAMTSSFNYIIHQLYTDLLYVYWNGKLAYIIKKSEIPDFSNLPSLNTNKDFIYKNKR